MKDVFSAEAGWTVGAPQQQCERRPRQEPRGPLPMAGRGLIRSASVGSTTQLRRNAAQKASSASCAKRSCCSSSSRVQASTKANGCATTSTGQSREGATQQRKELSLCTGMAVEIHSLENIVDLNGCFGVLRSFDEDAGRWIVDIDGSGEKKVKVVNIRPVYGAGSKANGEVWKTKWIAEYGQKQRCEDMATSLQRRRVMSTLQSLGEAFDPSEGLGAAAASLAQEALARLRTKAEQHQSVSSLAQPKVVPASLDPSPPSTPTNVRSRADQQAYVDLLACPRILPKRTPPTTPAVAVQRASEQQQRCAALAQPRAGTSAVEPVAKPWREELASRANALVPEHVASAQKLLADMRMKAQASARPSLNVSRPRSAGASHQRRTLNRESAEGGCQLPSALASLDDSGGECEASALLQTELRALVDEVLWAVLLQIRCCKKGLPSSSNSSIGSAIVSVPDTSLTERLGNLLIAAVGPALRPVARKVLAPGTSLVRRIRQEFPRLATHLSFRESDDLDLPPMPWNQADLARRLEEVRDCRDRLLSMDLTKFVMTWLNQKDQKLSCDLDSQN